MREIDLKGKTGSKIGNNVSIICKKFVSQGNFFLDDNVKIRAEKIILGNNAKIGKDTIVKGLREDMTIFSMGDESEIGFNTQILLPVFTMGDYSRLFNNSLCSGYKPLVIGHNCWIGQSSILNSAAELTIGNNVRMGGNSQIWTHVASGELLEGCKFYSEKPVKIEDNVWLMGFGHTVSPGVTLAQNTIVMSGSVVSKSTEAYHTYSGIPAIDITEKLNGWIIPSLENKFVMLKNFVEEFIEQHPEYKNRVFCFDGQPDHLNFPSLLKSEEPYLLFFKKVENWNLLEDKPHSIFDLSTKCYHKNRSNIEIDWMKFSIGYKARFIPFVSEMPYEE